MRFRYWLYYGMCCIGLVGVIRSHIRFVYALLFKAKVVPLYEHVGRWADKPIELFFFFLCAIVLLLYSLLIYSAWNRLKAHRTVQLIWRREPWGSVDMYWVLLLCLLNFAVGFGYWRDWFGEPGIILGDLLWIGMILAPVAVTWIIVRFRKNLHVHSKETLSGARKIYMLFIIVALLQLVSMVWPFVVRPLNMMGEFLEIPSRTLVNGQYVDDAAYYSEHRLLGNQPRYQMERDRSKAPPVNAEACLAIAMNPGVEQLLSATQKRAAYFYDQRAGLLCNTGPITPADWTIIRQAAPDTETLLRAESWMAKDIERGRFWQQRAYSAEELDFIANNRFALEFQLNGIWVLHHHNFVLGPINEYALGKPQREIFPQYGWLNMVVTSQVLEWLGGITYDKYFSVWYSYYFLYFILLMSLFWMIFRHAGYVALASTLSVGLMSCIPFVWYFQGPGLNPVRHFFDVFVIAAFYYYLTQQRPIYLYLALGFSILGVLNNVQLGLACLGALIATIAVIWFKRVIRTDRRQMLVVAAAVLMSVYLWRVHPFWNEGPLNFYYLMGVSSLPTSAFREIILLIVCGVSDVLLWRHVGKEGGQFQYLVMFLLLYAQASLLYSIWGSTLTHYLALSTIYVTAIVALLKLELDQLPISINKRELGVFFFFACSLALLVFGARSYTASEQEYETAFKSHENHMWNLDRASFVSSMNPQLFDHSANLIRKYSSSPAIYIISQYDAILPFLAQKYSAMPFFELSKFFLTPRELAQSIETIQQGQPGYLFVDTAIKREFALDAIDSRALYVNNLHGLSVERVKRMELLRQVFLAVQDDYELVEQGLLISVYKRK